MNSEIQKTTTISEEDIGETKRGVMIPEAPLPPLFLEEDWELEERRVLMLSPILNQICY